MALHKIASVILFDIGSHTDQTYIDEEETYFERSHRVLLRMIVRKVISGDKDEVGVVLFGSVETNNPLANGDAYMNINIVNPIEVASWEMYKQAGKIKSSSCKDKSDWLQATVVALQLLRDRTSGRKLKDKQVVIFSPFNMQLNYQKQTISTLLDCVQNDNVKIIIIGPEMDDESNYSGMQSISNFMEVLDNFGVWLTYDEADEKLQYFDKKRRNPRLQNIDLTIGDNIEIPVGWMKITIGEDRIDSWVTIPKEEAIKKEEKEKTNEFPECVDSARSNSLNDDLNMKISKDFNRKIQTEKSEEPSNYKVTYYGNSKVRLTYADIALLKRESGPACFTMFATTKHININPGTFVADDIYAVLPKPGSSKSKILLSCLVDSLMKANKVGIAKRVVMRNGKVYIGALIPMSDENGKHLYFMRLPTAEWKQTLPKQSILEEPSDTTKIKVVDDLIDSMMIEDGLLSEGKGLLLRDPDYQWRCHLLAETALNRCDDIIPDYINRLMNPLPDLYEKGQKIIDKLFDYFPVDQEIQEDIEKREARRRKRKEAYEKRKEAYEKRKAEGLQNTDIDNFIKKEPEEDKEEIEMLIREVDDYFKEKKIVKNKDHQLSDED